MQYAVPAWDLPAVPGRRRQSSAFRSVTSIASGAITPSTRRRWAATRRRSRRSSSRSRPMPSCRWSRPPWAVSPTRWRRATLHHELELVVAIGKSGANVAAGDAQGADLRLCGRPRHDAPRPAERHAREEAAMGHRQVVRAGRADRADPSGRADRTADARGNHARGQRRAAPARRSCRHGVGRAAHDRVPVAAVPARAGRPHLHRHAGRRGCRSSSAIGSRAASPA